MRKFSLDEWRAYLLAQAREYRSEGTVPRPVITISRETGAAAITIGQMVTDSFQLLEKGGARSWALFDQNIVKAFLADQDLPERLEEFIQEDGKPALEDAFEELLGLHPSTPALVQSMTRTILQLAKAGGVVLIGRGSHIICANLSHAFHVRLVAPLESRVRHIAEYFKLSKKEAAQYVDKMDRARRRYIRRYFGADVADPHCYHLVINTGMLGYKETANLVVDAASRHCGTK
ncbi:MAG TPA: cytidylate kinase-like family protein [Terrimicrobiaceae bacterium]